MSTVNHQYRSPLPKERYHIHTLNQPSFILSNIIFVCKLTVLIGLLVTFFSDHWAINPLIPYIYASYRKRCSVHLCTSNDVDPVLLVDISFFLAIINLNIEFINTTLRYCRANKALKIKFVLEGLVFLSTFVLTDCLIIFGICVSIQTYDLPMGYAYGCFIMSTSFSIIDWACSLRRLIVNCPDTIDLSENELSFDHSFALHRFRIDRFTSATSRCTTSPSNSITINTTAV